MFQSEALAFTGLLGAKTMEVTIIGGGMAGFSAAEAVRKVSKSTVIKMLSAEQEMLYSPCVLPHYLASHLPRNDVVLKSREDYAALGLEFSPGEKVESIEALSSYDRLIIAVGAEPLKPDVPGANLPGNFTLKSLSDADNLLKMPFENVVVVGSGPVGVETALALRQAQRKVWLVEKMGTVLPAMLDIPAAIKAKELLQKEGIEVLCKAEVSRVVGSSAVEAVLTAGELIPCEAVVWNVGMQPATEFLNGSGVALDSAGYVKTDQYLQTSLPGVYACGDCSAVYDPETEQYRQLLLWHRAKEEGTLAGYNVMGRNIAAPPAVNRVVVNIGGTSFAALGQLPAEQGLGYDYRLGCSYFRFTYRQGVLEQVHSINDPRRLGRFNYLLGKKGNPPTQKKLFTMLTTKVQRYK